MKFAAAGYVCIDYYPDFDNRHYPTGNGVNVLFNLLDMREDVDASVVSAISDDNYGKLFTEAFDKRGIDRSHLEIISGGETPNVPLYLVNNDRVHGEPVRGIMKNYQFSEAAVDYICRHDIVHSDFTGRLIPHLAKIKKQGAKTYFDLSNQKNHPNLNQVLSSIYCGLVSFEGDVESGKEFLHYACSQGAQVMIATFGEMGSVAYDGSVFYQADSVPAKKVVNTVGAGDSYFAGFISGMMDEKTIPECMRRGAERAAQIVAVFEPYL